MKRSNESLSQAREAQAQKSFPMKTHKIRGHKRHWPQIEAWLSANKHLDLEHLKQRQRDYTKLWINPWYGLSMWGSAIPTPRGKTKTLMLAGLIEIYEAWQEQLETLGESYYLKIWLCEPRFMRSQVVCAIGDCLDFYQNTFYKPEETKRFPAEHYGELASKLSKFEWQYHWDEEHHNNGEIGEPEDYESEEEYLAELRWFEKLLKKPHRRITFEAPIGRATEAYSFKQGTAWLGEIKKAKN